MLKNEHIIAFAVVCFCVLLGVAIIDETINYLMNIR